MALEEVAINSVLPHNDVATGSSSAQVDASTQLLAPGQENTRAPSPAFHSMLRTATETGDLGVFGINPSLLPQLNPHALPRGKRSGPRQSEFALPQRDGHGLDHGSLRSPRDSSGSFHPSVRNATGRKTFRASSQEPRDRNGRSHSMTDTARPVHHLARHRSYANIGRFEDALDLDRSRSPLAYPARLKRPGYRSASSALSDQISPGYRTNSGITKGQRLRTKSPSALSQSRVPSEYSRNSNYAFSAYPANAIPSFGSRYYGQPLGDALTPKTSMYRGSFASSVTGNRPALPKLGSQKGLPASALYYDYTEDFEDDFTYRGSRSGPSWPLFTIDATIPEARSSGNDLYLKHVLNGDPALTKWPMAMNQQLGLLPAKETSPSQVNDGFPNSVEPSEHMAEAARASAVELLVRHSSSSSHSSVPAQGVSFTDSNHSRDGSSFSSPVVSSPDQPYSLEPFKEHEASSNKSNGPSKASATRSSAFFSLPSWKIPSMKFSHVDLVGRAVGPSLARATSSDGLAETDHAGIFAPVPERPLTSQGHRGTYNSFFSMDEGLAELEEVLTTLESSDRPYTPDQFIRDSLRSSTILRNSTISRQSRQSVNVPSASPGEPGEPVPGGIPQSPYELEDASNVVTGKPNLQQINGLNHSSNILELPSGTDRSARFRSPRHMSYLSGVDPIHSSSELEVRKGDFYSFAPTASPGAHPPSYINDDIAAHIRPRKASLVANKISPPLDDPSSNEPFPRLVPQEEIFEGIQAPLLDNNLPLGQGLPIITVRKSSLQSTRAPTILAPGSSFPQLSKDLPLFPRQSSLVAPAPLVPTVQSQSPLSTTWSPPTSNSDLVVEGTNSAIDESSVGLEGSKGQAIKQKFKVKRRSIRPPSRASSPESRPWNDDESYPWTDIPPDIEMRLPPPPPPALHRDRHISKPPLFKVRARKSSAATDATVKINRAAAAPHSDRPLSAPTDLFMGGTKGHSTQRLFGHLGRRFGYGGHLDNERNGDLVNDSATEDGITHLAPSINLAIPSPTLNPAEVRSFFSDDSSLVRHRGSVRQRFSQFRSRLPSSRKSSSDEVRDTERIAAAFSVRRGRLSRKASEEFGEETVGMSTIEYQVRKVVETVKGWFQKVRGIGPRKKSRDFHLNPSIDSQAGPASNNVYHGF
ncbi:MAG: hypothetical protein M1812_001581 [Candelaria pacifica]|nr:MAG: hypothetical protein M1812_001581 [Candelaria pacifica]